MVKSNRTSWVVLILGLAVLLPNWSNAQDSNLRPVSTKYAITNATIVQAPGRVIERGTVVFENGVIKSVGANVTVPADAWVIEADSMYIYAGFISGMSNIGVPKPKDDKERLDSKLKQNPPYEKAGITPGANVVDQLDAGDKSISDFKKIGFTAALTAPHKGMMSGRSAVILLGGSTPEGMVMKDNYSLYSQLGGTSGMYPSTVIGVMAKYRDMYRKAEQSSAYQSSYGSGMERPVRDMTIEALHPVVSRQLPVSFKSPNLLDIHRVLTLKKDLGFNLHLVEVKQGWDAIDAIKNSGAGLFLSLDLPEMKEEKKKEKKYEEGEEGDGEEKAEEAEKSEMDIEKEGLEKRKQEMIAMHYKQASMFQSQGVRFGFSTLNVKTKDFKKNLSGVIKNGLTEDQALAALTTTPAQMLGVSSLMGSIDNGKMANLVITDKPYFDEKSNVRYVFVDGMMTEYEAKKEKKKKEGTGEDIDPNGKYNYSYSSEDGQSWSGTFSIEGSKDNYSGTFYLSFNDTNNDLQDIEVSGNLLTFSFPVDGGGQTVDVSISLEYDGDAFSGILVAGPFGSYDMEASKDPN